LQNAPLDQLGHFFIQMRIGAMLNWDDWDWNLWGQSCTFGFLKLS
jgi:hypothetical protein